MHAWLSNIFGDLPSTFWYIWLITLVNRICGFVTTFLVLFLTIDRGYSASYAGIVVVVYGLGSVAANIVGGLAADRFGRRPVLLLSQLATAAGTLILGFSGGQVAVAAIAFVVGFATGTTRPAMMAIVADVVPKDDQARAFSLNFWSINLGFAIAATVAGFIAQRGYILLFICEASAVLVCAAITYWRIPESRPLEPNTAGAPNIAPLSIGPLLDRPFLVLILLTTLIAAIYQQSATTLPLSMIEAGMRPSDYGLAISMNGLLVVVLQIPMTRIIDRVDHRILMPAAAVLSGCGFGLLIFRGENVWFYALTVGIWTIGECILGPTTMQMATKFAPVNSRAQYMGAYSLSSSLPTLLAPASGGFLLQYLGSDAIWIACAVLGAITAVGYALLARIQGDQIVRR